MIVEDIAYILLAVSDAEGLEVGERIYPGMAPLEDSSGTVELPLVTFTISERQPWNATATPATLHRVEFAVTVFSRSYTSLHSIAETLCAGLQSAAKRGTMDSPIVFEGQASESDQVTLGDDTPIYQVTYTYSVFVTIA